MSCKLTHKTIVSNKVIFSYLCDSFEDTINEGKKVIQDIEGYCRDTGKTLEHKTYVTPFKNECIFEIIVTGTVEI